MSSLQKYKVFPNRYHVGFFALLWIFFAIYGSLVPLNFEAKEFAVAVEQFSKLQYLGLGSTSNSDWTVNVLLLVPIGFFGLGAIAVDQRRSFSIYWLIPVVVLCGMLSIAIEFSQFWFPPRNPSLYDIVAQNIGSFIGGFLWIISGQALVDWIRTFFTDLKPKKTIDWLLQAYIFGLLFFSFVPFDLTISVAELYKKYESGRILLVPFSYNYSSTFMLFYHCVLDSILFIPVGYFCATVLQSEKASSRKVWLSTSYGFLIIIFIEAFQLLVISRYTTVTDLVTGTFGAFIGVLTAKKLNYSTGDKTESSTPFFLRKSTLLWAGFSVAYMAILLLGFWYPYDFIYDKGIIKEKLGSFFQIPFSTLYQGSYYNAITQVIRKSLLFVPLGLFIGQSILCLLVPQSIQLTFLLLAVIFLVIFGMGIELGQVVISSSVANTTDVILYFFGSLLGIFIALRLKKSVEVREKAKIG